MISAMIDLETLSLQPEAAILSAGVAIFNEDKVLETAGWAMDLEDVHGHIDMKTLKWWMDPERDAARPSSFGGKLKAFNFGYELKSFLAQHNPQEYWANDPEFDLVVLKRWWARQNAIALTNSRVLSLGESPLDGLVYRMSRSYRTIIAECERLGHDTKDLKGIYVAHDPVEDAASQARAVIAARKLIGGC